MRFWKRKKKPMSMKVKLKKAVTVRVDMDGVLCYGESFTPFQCLHAPPRLDMIRKVNELSFKKYIIIWTARRDNLLEATSIWLKRNGVHYHAIDNKKNPSDIYIDDKAINSEDFLKGG